MGLIYKQWMDYNKLTLFSKNKSCTNTTDKYWYE